MKHVIKSYHPSSLFSIPLFQFEVFKFTSMLMLLPPQPYLVWYIFSGGVVAATAVTRKCEIFKWVTKSRFLGDFCEAPRMHRIANFEE